MFSWVQLLTCCCTAKILKCGSVMSPVAGEEGSEGAPGAAARCSSSAGRWSPAEARRAAPLPSARLRPASRRAPRPASPVVSRWRLSAWCRPERCSGSLSLWFSVNWNDTASKFTTKTSRPVNSLQTRVLTSVPNSLCLDPLIFLSAPFFSVWRGSSLEC